MQKSAQVKLDVVDEYTHTATQPHREYKERLEAQEGVELEYGYLGSQVYNRVVLNVLETDDWT